MFCGRKRRALRAFRTSSSLKLVAHETTTATNDLHVQLMRHIPSCHIKQKRSRLCTRSRNKRCGNVVFMPHKGLPAASHRIFSELCVHSRNGYLCESLWPETLASSCVWDRIGPASPSPSGVAHGIGLIPVDSAGEAAGVVSEVAGEEKIGGNGVEGTFNKDMTNDGMTLLRHTNKSSSP